MTRYAFIILTICSFALTACDEVPSQPGYSPPAAVGGGAGATTGGTPGKIDPMPTNITKPVGPNTDTSAPKTADLNLTGFETVTAKGNCEVTVTTGEPKVTVECSEKSFDKLKVAASGKELSITADGVDAAKALVTVSGPVTGFSTGGNVLGHLKDYKGASLALTTKDQSMIDGNGSVDELNATSDGASSIRLKALVAKNAKVTASGKCFVELNVSDNCNATGSDNSVITVDGNPKAFEKHPSGQAIINKPRSM